MRPSQYRLYAVLALAALIFGSGLTWGLPHHEDWQSDSLTPYHPLVGLGQLFSFGYFHKYPLVHQLLLGILDIPVMVAAFIDSIEPNGFSLMALLRALQSPEYATPLLVIGRLVTIAMAVGTVWLIYLFTRSLAGERAALSAALLVCLNTVMNQLAPVAKVDVPYVFWAMLSLHMMVRAAQTGQTRAYVTCALAACLSFGTKDQAYAIFVLPFIAWLVVEPIWLGDRTVPLTARLFARPVRAFLIAFAIGTLLVENVLLNWTGLLKRIAHLTGDAGFRSAAYSTDAMGVFAQLVDFERWLIEAQGGPLAHGLCALGIALTVLDRTLASRDRLLRLLPLLASVSYYLFFVQIVRQVADRFALFPSVVLCFYGGVAVAWLFESARSVVLRWAVRATVAAAVLYGLFATLQLDLDLVHDPRYDAERFMARELRAGARVEYYGYLHYLPRFPAQSKPYRIKSGVLELPERAPDYVVLSSLDYGRYFGSKTSVSVGGRLTATTRRARDRASDFPELYRRLFGGELGYVEVARFERRFKSLKRHPSVPEMVRIYKRAGT
jgi:hypothetical protein